MEKVHLTPPGQRNSILRGQSCQADARQAAREFHSAVLQPDMALVIFFCCSKYDLAVLAEEMRTLFSGILVVGCTTAGEIGPLGYHEHSLSGVSFSASAFNIVSGSIAGLQQFETTSGQALVADLLPKLKNREPQAVPDHCFALLLSDGLSLREEQLTCALQSALGKIPLVGGSAGGGEGFGETLVYFDGQFRSDSAALILVATRLPFKLFMTQHFVAGEERLVVTEADTFRRVVKEINGLPAAEVYAEILGVSVGDLSPQHFAASPIVVLVNGTNYVRAIQKVHADGSLTFFCAIENGLVFRVAKGVDLLSNLERAFWEIRAQIGRPQLVLAYECVSRTLEIRQSRLAGRVGEVLRQNNTTGFSTYGEQFRGVHVNQTLVGIAIGNG